MMNWMRKKINLTICWCKNHNSIKKLVNLKKKSKPLNIKTKKPLQ